MLSHDHCNDDRAGSMTIPKKNRDLLLSRPEDRVDFEMQADNQVLMQPTSIHVADLRGILYRPDQPVLTIEEMDEAIAQAVCATMDNNT